MMDAHKAMESLHPRKSPHDGCTHGIAFPEHARNLPVREIRKQYPRLDGQCPLGCGYFGIYYADMYHYIAGDW
jgi:hypothetical protein